MYGLPKETDLAFLLRKRLERVEISQYQAQLHFADSICISIEGDCEIDGEPVVYEALRRLVGNSVLEVSIQDGGTTDVVFSGGGRLSILDSNAVYESYQISAPGMTIVV